MTRNLQSLVEYLGRIVEAIERIQGYIDDLDDAAFLGSKLVQDAVIRNFEVIGEASNNIEKHYAEFAVQNPDVPFAFAY